jgi:hypothetical protein
MKYLGTFQARAGLATDKLAHVFREGRILMPGSVKSVNVRVKG